ncbi:uncharacterized protein COLE_00415 [Cutaneotrichosporon oleaginosum]|nr:hypothetical protein COLE_00415 [Cutaneotrichosporon oleaginosum]
MYLDALVLVCFVVFIRQLYRYARAGSGAPALLKLVALAQTLLIPFSVTPERLPVLGPQVAGYHHLVVLGQLLLFGISFVLQIGQVPITELLRAALPELLAFSVELQRRAERSNDVELDKLERLKYPLKGA